MQNHLESFQGPKTCFKLDLECHTTIKTALKTSDEAQIWGKWTCRTKPNTGPYVKLVTLTFDTGAFSVLKQSSTFTSSDYYNSDNDEYGLVFFKYVDSGSLDNLYIATIGLGLDDSS